MQWTLRDEPPALLLKFTERTFTSGGSAAGVEGGNEAVPSNGIDSVFHSYSHNKDDSTNGERDIDKNNG